MLTPRRARYYDRAYNYADYARQFAYGAMQLARNKRRVISGRPGLSAAQLGGAAAAAGAAAMYGKKRKLSNQAVGKRAVIIKKDGKTRERVPQKKRRVRKKKSLQQKVSEVRKLIPPKSKKTFRDFKTMVMDPSGTPNRQFVYSIDMVTPTQLETYLQNLTAVDTSATVDYSAANSSVDISLYYKLMVKNGSTGNATIKYCFYKCKDNSGSCPLDEMVDDLTERGYTAPTVSASTAAGATNSFVPKRADFRGTVNFHSVNFTGNAVDRHWEAIGGVKTCVMQPGDECDIIHSCKVRYKPEILDNNAFTYLSGYSYVCMLSVHGDICHDQTNFLLVGRGLWHLDCEEQKQGTVTYANPKGLREISYSDTLTNTNFTVPVSADNQVSAIEIQDL